MQKITKRACSKINLNLIDKTKNAIEQAILVSNCELEKWTEKLKIEKSGEVQSETIFPAIQGAAECLESLYETRESLLNKY